MSLTASFRPLLRAMVAAGVVLSDPATAVRVNPDGHGQALIYPYYTARSTVSGHAFVTALSVSRFGSSSVTPSQLRGTACKAGGLELLLGPRARRERTPARTTWRRSYRVPRIHAIVCARNASAQ